MLHWEINGLITRSPSELSKMNGLFTLDTSVSIGWKNCMHCSKKQRNQNTLAAGSSTTLRLPIIFAVEEDCLAGRHCIKDRR